MSKLLPFLKQDNNMGWLMLREDQFGTSVIDLGRNWGQEYQVEDCFDGPCIRKCR